ncbi:MAG: FecR family protein [Methylococcaceae bacterium]|nr:FecR family protein [Methylococcaceae bacterium]
MKKLITNNRDRLEQEVVEWLIYLTSGEAMPNDFAEFAQWQKRSPAHKEAYRKISGLWDNLDKPLLAWRDQTDISIQPQSYYVQQSAAASIGIQKQSPLKKISGFIVTAVLLTVLFTSLFPDYLISTQADYRTRIGEQKTISLSDGSSVHLNTNSAIKVNYNEKTRTVELIKGEAVFTVAHNTNRPFIVRSGEVRTRAVGTQFVVRYDSRLSSVTLLEGKVLVASDRESNINRTTLTLIPGDRISFSENRLDSEIKHHVSGADAWRKGRLQFDNITLEQAVNEINRYRRGSVKLLASQLAMREINGVVDLTQIDAWLDALETLMPLTVYRFGPWIFIRAKT